VEISGKLYNIPISLNRVRARRLPQLPTEVTDARWRLVKEWGAFKLEQVRNEKIFYEKMKNSQQRALDELKIESEELYEAAIKIDRDLIPYVAQGPTETPPIENYRCPDGDYIDVSRKWD
jgi:large subunit ribosomal protein L40